MTTTRNPGAKAVTPPKGRPTPGRRPATRTRTFGSTFQWAASAVVLAVVLVAVYLLLFR